MDVCITIKDQEITVDDTIKDPKMKQQITTATKSYLGELIELSKMPSDIKVSIIISIHPQNCCICLEPLTAPVELSCECKEKYYHRECVDKWFKRKKECPTCRKNLRGVGYRKAKVVNPYNTKKRQKSYNQSPNSPSQFLYQCEGGTHPKKSSFKSLNSALKHAKEKHHIDIDFINRRGVQLWYCRHRDCIGSEYVFTNEELLSHLQHVHHLNVITSK